MFFLCFTISTNGYVCKKNTREVLVVFLIFYVLSGYMLYELEVNFCN